MNRMRLLLLSIVNCCVIVAQTKIDLQNQSGGGVDFSKAPFTKPAQTGTALPPTCSTGEAYILTTAVPGANWFICTATKTWSLQAVAGPQGPQAPQGPQGPAGTGLPGCNSDGAGNVTCASYTATTGFNAGVGDKDSAAGFAPANGLYRSWWIAPGSPSADSAWDMPDNTMLPRSGEARVLVYGPPVARPNHAADAPGTSAPVTTYPVRGGGDAIPSMTGTPSDGCTQFSGGKLTSTGTACGSGVEDATVNVALKYYDPSKGVYDYDDFIGAYDPIAGTLGKFFARWGNNVAPTVTGVIIPGEPGAFRLDTTNTAGPWSGIVSNVLSTKFSIAEPFTIRARARLNQTDSNTQAKIGVITQTIGGVDQDGAYIEATTAGNWICKAENGGTPTSVVMTTTSTNLLWFQVRRVDSTTIGCKIASTVSGLASATEYTVASHVPSSGGALFLVAVGNSGASVSETLDIGFFDFYVAVTR